MMKPITKFASTVRDDGARRRHVLDGVPRGDRTARPGPSFLEIAARRPRRQGPARERGHPGRAEQLPRLDARASATPTTSSGSPSSWSTPSARASCSAPRSGRRAATSRRSSSSATLNIPAYMNGAGRGTLPPGDPHHFHLTRRYAFNNADVILIVGTPFDFRMGYGKRLSREATGRPDRHGLPDGRQEPRHHLGLVGDPGAILGAVAKAAKGRAKGEQAQGLARELRAEEQRLNEKRLPRAHEGHARRSTRCASRTRSTSSSPRTPIYIGDGGDIVTFSGGVVQPKGARPWMDPGPLGTIGVGMPFVHRRPSRPDPDRRSCACSATARSASPASTSTPPCASTCRSSASSATTRHEPDPLRPDPEVRRGARRHRQHAGDVRYDEFAKMLGGYGEEVTDPKDIGPALERARETRQAVADQRVGRPERVRARDHEPDDVQVGEGFRMVSKALEGVRVIDMTHVQSGPSATQLLAWLGADVIKIEAARARGHHPHPAARPAGRRQPLLHDAELQQAALTLNMKSDEGKEIFRELVDRSDVLVENFGPGVIDRLGFTWEHLQELNPRLIYASHQGLRPGRATRRQGVRGHRPGDGRLDEHHRLRGRAAGRDRRPDRRLGQRACTCSARSARRSTSATHTGRGQRVQIAMRAGC